MKYNKSKIMKRAWELKKDWSTKNLTFSRCLEISWKEAKEEAEESKFYGVKFENRMTITACGYTRELSRWTKGSHDRVYINYNSGRKTEGWVDVKTGFVNLYDDGSVYCKKMVKMIMSMEF